MHKREKITLLIPAYQPNETLLHLIKEVLQNGIEHIVVVNDGSDKASDPIFDALRQMRCIVTVHTQNRGKGRALKTGILTAQKEFAEDIGVVTADADGQHTPKDILRLADALLATPDSVFFGCRDFSGQGIPLRSRIGNNITAFATRLLLGIDLRDTQTGLRAFPSAVLPTLIEVEGERFEYEMNALLRLHSDGQKIQSVSIETVYRKGNPSSHFHPLRDSAKIYRVFIRFLLSSAISFGTDILLFYIFVQLLGPSFPTGYILAATVGARIVSSAINFSINRFSVFKSHDAIPKTAFRYLLLCIGIMLCSAFFVTFLCFLLPLQETICKIVVDIVLFFASFYLQRNWVFKK